MGWQTTRFNISASDRQFITKEFFKATPLSFKEYIDKKRLCLPLFSPPFKLNQIQYCSVKDFQLGIGFGEKVKG
ncbi:hypothetical protein FDUTEX481_09376 [Tolypothrix sp. PCC 7601]|nr:hypothetical protein FDUTEX481_09376 [Tolypothrix sp. PCC 7601]